MEANNGWRCPKCHSRELDVEIKTSAKLIQYDEHGEDFSTDNDESVNGDHEWGSGSIMTCLDCGHAENSCYFADAADLYAFNKSRKRKWRHSEHRAAEPAHKIKWGVGRKRNMVRLQYPDGATYDAYPELCKPWNAPGRACRVMTTDELQKALESRRGSRHDNYKFRRGE